MSTAAHEYREGIRLAWQGEQWGKAFFDALADAAGDADQCAKWTVLADLEEATGEATGSAGRGCPGRRFRRGTQVLVMPLLPPIRSFRGRPRWRR